MVNNNEIKEATFKRDYVKDHISILTLIFFVQIGFAVALGCFIFYQFTTRPKPIFFQATINNQIIAPLPLDEPVMNSAAILNWSIEAIRVAYSFNYHSIQDHLVKITPYFDKRGLDRFFAVMADDRNVKQVLPNQLIVSIKAREAPKIIKEGKVDGRYAWRVLLPMSVRYENLDIIRRQDVDIDLYIWRVPETEAPIGIKITNFQMQVKQGYDQQVVKRNRL